MGNAAIPRRQGGSYTTIGFENYEISTLEKRKAENLSQARSVSAATAVSNFALFAGGYYYGYYSSDVDAYSMNLTHSTPTKLDKKRTVLAATAGQSYALFGGGNSFDYGTDYYPNVDAYNSDLVHSTAADLSEARSHLAATTVGDYSLFAGGELPANFSSNKVDVYDNNLAQSSATALSLDRGSLVATTVGEHAIFASGDKWNGKDGTAVRNVDAYSSSLVHSTLADVTCYSYDAATAVGDYALFGADSGAIVDVYNSSLVKLTPVNLSDEKSSFAATTVGNFALFGGGRYLNEKDYATVEGFDNNLVLHQFEDLSVAWSPSAATTVSNYALFGGGYSSPTYIATVDCYEYTSKDLELTLYKGTKYKFQDMDAEATVEADIETKTIATPATGYIKLKKVTLS